MKSNYKETIQEIINSGKYDNLSYAYKLEGAFNAPILVISDCDPACFIDKISVRQVIEVNAVKYDYFPTISIDLPVDVETKYIVTKSIYTIIPVLSFVGINKMLQKTLIVDIRTPEQRKADLPVDKPMDINWD